MSKTESAAIFADGPKGKVHQFCAWREYLNSQSLLVVVTMKTLTHYFQSLVVDAIQQYGSI